MKISTCCHVSKLNRLLAQQMAITIQGGGLQTRALTQGMSPWSPQSYNIITLWSRLGMAYRIWTSVIYETDLIMPYKHT